MKPVKIGMIIEGTRNGPDQKVFEHAIKKMAPRVEIEWATMGNKIRLIDRCGTTAGKLLGEEDCCQVVVLWDLLPTRGKTRAVSRRRDIDQIHASLRKEKISKSRFKLVCVTGELESWLLADSRALRIVLSREQHQVRAVKNFQYPDREPNPKKTLERLFSQHKAYYSVALDPLRIAQNVPDCRELGKSPSFMEFAGIIKRLSSPSQGKRKHS